MISRILRILPPFKGKQRLARLLLRKTIKEAQGLLVDGKYRCAYHVPNARETIGFEILVNGIYEEDTILFIKSKISSHKVLLDIGANIGAITIPLKRFCPHLTVICVEAAPWIFKFLQENIARNELSGVIAVNKAIAARPDEEVEFFSPSEKFGKGSMAPVFTSSGVKVKTTTLDSLTHQYAPSDVGLIKIDVEGFESHAFRGGHRLLSHTDSPDILFEFVDWAELAAGVTPGESQRVLMSYGYTLHVFQNNVISSPIVEPLYEGSVLLYATKSRMNQL